MKIKPKNLSFKIELATLLYNNANAYEFTKDKYGNYWRAKFKLFEFDVLVCFEYYKNKKNIVDTVMFANIQNNYNAMKIKDLRNIKAKIEEQLKLKTK